MNKCAFGDSFQGTSNIPFEYGSPYAVPRSIHPHHRVARITSAHAYPGSPTPFPPTTQFSPFPPPYHQMDKAETIEKFNKKYNHSLYDFLAYYGGIPLSFTDPKHSVEIVDYTKSTLTLNYFKGDRSKTTVIPFSPPLRSLDGAAVRLQLMAFEAADAFRVSPYRGDKYLWPRSIGGVVTIAGVASGIVLSTSPKFFYKLLSRRAPRLAVFVRDKIRAALLLALVIHLWEYVTFLRPKLDKFRVYGSTRLRWFVTCMFEGLPSWSRYWRYTDALARKRIEFEREHK